MVLLHLLPPVNYVFLVFLIPVVGSDRVTYVKYISAYARDASPRLQAVNELGVSIIGKSSITFYIRACEAAVVAVADVNNIRNDLGNYFIFIMAGPKRRRNIVMNSCFSCSSHETRRLPVLECNKFKQFWMSWGTFGVSIGQGSIVGMKTVLQYRSNNDYQFNFLLVSTLRGHTTYFKFPVVHKLLFIKPANDGSTVVEVPETISVGAVILTIEVNMKNVTCDVTGTHADKFYIEGKQLKTLISFNGSRISLYTVQISTNVDRHVVMHVVVKKSIQYPPIITKGFVTSVPEELPMDTVIARIVSQTTGNLNNELTFNLEGEDSKYFDVSSGLLTMKRRLDRESTELSGRNLQPITLKVNNEYNLTAETSLVLTVKDVNDNVPTFSSPIFRIAITENTTYDDPILNLNCTDLDDGLNGQVHIRNLTGNDVDSRFRLEGDKLYVDGSRVDYETMAPRDFMYILTIQAVDMPTSGHVNTGSTVVLVQILPRNEHAPRWTYPLLGENGSFPDQTIFENQTVGSVILSFQATDDDIGSGSDVIFILQSVKTDRGVNASHHFFLEPRHGALITAINLDCDDKVTGTQHYFLTILVADGDFLTQAELKLIILDVDDNDPIFEREYFIISPPFAAAQPIFVFTITDEDVIPIVNVTIDSPQSNMFYVEANVGENTWKFISKINIDLNTQVSNYVILKTTNRREVSRYSEAIVVIYHNEQGTYASSDVIDSVPLCSVGAVIASASDDKPSSKCACE